MWVQLTVGIYNQGKLWRENTATVINSFNYYSFLGTMLELSMTTHSIYLLYLHKGRTLNRDNTFPNSTYTTVESFSTLL